MIRVVNIRRVTNKKPKTGTLDVNTNVQQLISWSLMGLLTLRKFLDRNKEDNYLPTL